MELSLSLIFKISTQGDYLPQPRGYKRNLYMPNILQLLVFEEPNIKIYRFVKGDIDRREGQYHLSHTDISLYWALQTPIIVSLLFCVKRLVDIVKKREGM